MKKLLILALLILTPAVASAQNTVETPAPLSGGMLPQVGTTPIPIVVNQAAPAQPPAGSVINIGGVFGPIIEPYINSLIGALLTALMTWILVQVKTRLGINIDQAQADVYLRAAKNQASSLVADGMVKIEQSGKVTVNNTALAAAANDLLASVPDAAAHFTLQNKPDVVAAKILDMIPQIPAHAAVTEAANVVAAAAEGAAAGIAKS